MNHHPKGRWKRLLFPLPFRFQEEVGEMAKEGFLELPQRFQVEEGGESCSGQEARVVLGSLPTPHRLHPSLAYVP